jgi:hypothetical protein
MGKPMIEAECLENAVPRGGQSQAAEPQGCVAEAREPRASQITFDKNQGRAISQFAA